MKLLISQKDSLFKIIENSEHFSPNQFEIFERKNGGIHDSRIKFKNSNYYFLFCNDRDYSGFFLNYSPGEEKFLEITSNLNFNHAIAHFIKWLINLNREITSPNLWTKFESQISEIALNFGFDNSKFTFSEYQDLNSKINLMITNLSTIKFETDEQLKGIQINLEHLLTLAENLGKFDWKNLFVGTMISIIIQLEVNKEKGIFYNYFLN